MQASDIPLVTNPSLLEVYKVMLSLYKKGSVTKADLKDFNFSLKEVINLLPDAQNIYLQ